MRTYLILSLAAAALVLLAIFAPAGAAVRKHGVTAAQQERLELSAHSYHRAYRYHRRYYYARPYYRPYYHRPYYYRPYAYWGPRYYYPYYSYGYYPYYYYYRRPGFYFGFAF